MPSTLKSIRLECEGKEICTAMEGEVSDDRSVVTLKVGKWSVADPKAYRQKKINVIGTIYGSGVPTRSFAAPMYLSDTVPVKLTARQT